MLSTTRPLLAGHNGHHNGDVQQIIHFAHPTTGKTQVVVHAWMDRCDCDCGFDSAHLHHTMTLYYDRFTTILVLVIYHNPGPGCSQTFSGSMDSSVIHYDLVMTASTCTDSYPLALPFIMNDAPSHVFIMQTVTLAYLVPASTSPHP